MGLKALIRKGVYRMLRLDALTNWLITISGPHHEIHEGNAFLITDVDTDVDIIGPKYWRVSAPDSDEHGHWGAAIWADGPGLVELFEGPTEAGTPVPGDALTAYNRNRNSSNTATVLTKKDAEVAADGTRLNHARVGTAGNPARAAGGEASTRSEMVLGAGLEYIVKFTADADDTTVWILFDWYEHTDSDA